MRRRLSSLFCAEAEAEAEQALTCRRVGVPLDHLRCFSLSSDQSLTEGAGARVPGSLSCKHQEAPHRTAPHRSRPRLTPPPPGSTPTQGGTHYTVCEATVGWARLQLQPPRGLACLHRHRISHSPDRGTQANRYPTMTNIPRPHAHMPVCHTVQTEHLYTAAWWTCTPSSPTVLSATVPFCPILSHSLFHPVPSSHSPRLRLLSTFPWTIWHAPVPPLPIQTSTRSLQSYSSLRRAASLVRAHTAALPRLRLSLSHTASALLRAENRASPPPERGCCEDSEDTPANYITSCCVLANARESSLFYN